MKEIIESTAIEFCKDMMNACESEKLDFNRYMGLSIFLLQKFADATVTVVKLSNDGREEFFIRRSVYESAIQIANELEDDFFKIKPIMEHNLKVICETA